MNIFIYGAPYKDLIINVTFVQNNFQEVGRLQFTWKIYMHKVDIYMMEHKKRKIHVGAMCRFKNK